MLIPKVQAYLRESARQRYTTVAVPPFTAFFHPHDHFAHFNYAIPDHAELGEVQAVLVELKATFRQRDCQPRFEFIEEFSPHLAAALRQANFEEEGRQQLMICTPETFQALPALLGLQITPLTPESPVPVLQKFLDTQRHGFNPTATEASTPEQANLFTPELHHIKSFFGEFEGQPAAVASYTAPLDGVIELVGVATVESLRRRGIAAAMSHAAVAQAFAQGASLACLTAADERAGHVYERVGFRPVATMLAYSVPVQ